MSHNCTHSARNLSVDLSTSYREKVLKFIKHNKNVTERENPIFFRA